jgi:hypothetical protein
VLGVSDDSSNRHCTNELANTLSQLLPLYVYGIDIASNDSHNAYTCPSVLYVN